MSVEQVVLAISGTAAVVASLLVVITTVPRPKSALEALYLALPAAGVIALVAAVARWSPGG